MKKLLFLTGLIVTIILILTYNKSDNFSLYNSKSAQLDIVKEEELLKFDEPLVRITDIAEEKLDGKTLDLAEELAKDGYDVSEITTERDKWTPGFFSKKKTPIPRVPDKTLHLYNVNTNENLSITYWSDGEYIQSSLLKLNNFMRDWRQNDTAEIDPELYDIMHTLYKETDASDPIHVLSAYRTPETNKYLRTIGYKPAKNSQHLFGKAADITIPDVPVSELKEEALEENVGGVGYYPNNNYIHVDTAEPRQW